MVDSPSCALCRRRADSLVPVARQVFCLPCLTAIGRFMREGPPTLVESLWRASPREQARRALSDMVDDEILKVRQVAPKGDAAVESLIAEFKANFAQEQRAAPATAEAVGPADAATHLDLAIGYRELGQGDDALNEASIALTDAAQLGSRAHEAAEIVLDPGSLKGSLEATLSALRSALHPD